MSQERVIEKALLDSGATESFIHPWLVKQLTLATYQLKKPRQVRNMDGTNNQQGKVTTEAKFQVFHESHCQTHCFLIADIGEDNIILGYPFFKAANPMIDWPTGKVHGVLVLTEIWPILVSDMWTKLQKIVDKIKWSNVAQQLAINALDKEEKTWQELVPKNYHKFGSIFSEKDSERFPGTRKWDHAIDLKPDAPTSIDCHIYPLSPKEKEKQKEFLAENLQLHWIRCLNSPYASGFFLIQKKDRKFRPIQDYQNLNKWTVPNRYPLPLINDLIYDVTAASYSISALDYLLRSASWERLLPAPGIQWNAVEVPALQLHLQDPLQVERNKVRLRQETQLSGTGIAKALLILLQTGYMGAGNDGVGRCLLISPARIEPVNRWRLYRMGSGRLDSNSNKGTSWGCTRLPQS